MKISMSQPSRPTLFLLGAFAMVALPNGVMAMNNDGGELSLNANPLKTSLPFLREASSGDYLTRVRVLGGIPTTTDSTALSGGLSSQANHCQFTDIKNHAAQNSIQYLYDQGIAGGRRPCYFDPDLLATRAEVTTMSTRSVQASTPAATESVFPDVDKNNWSSRYIKSAKTRGVIKGYPDGQFRPDQAVNKVEALKILTRTFGLTSADIDSQLLSQYTDLDATQWYAPYVSSALKANLVGPNGALPQTTTEFHPAEYLTRAEIAKMVEYMILRRQQIQ